MDMKELLSAARVAFNTEACTTVEAASDILVNFGAERIDFERYREEFCDEFIRCNYVAGAWTLHNESLLRSRATSEEREIFAPDSDEPFDPYEYGVENAEWTTWTHEINTLTRATVVLESDPADRAVVGNFRVFGGAQWLRELLWAATGVIPRDPGSPTEASSLFGEAFVLTGRPKFEPMPLTSI